MCTVPGIFLRWEFTVIIDTGTPTTLMPTVVSAGPSGVPPPLTVNSTRFTYSRLSARDRLPLISRMLISSVSEGLNGVEVNCIDIALAASESATTTIRTISARGSNLSLN